MKILCARSEARAYPRQRTATLPPGHARRTLEQNLGIARQIRQPSHSAACGLDLRAPLGLATAMAACLLAFAAAFGRADLAAASLRGGRLRREVEAPARSARASSSTIASSSVMVSGVLSAG